MRTVITLVLINCLCLTIGLSLQKSNFENHNNKKSHIRANSKAESNGEQEYYIPSYNSHSQQQNPQEFIYPKNFENAYQYLQQKYSNRVPSNIGQKLWLSPLYGYGNYKHITQYNGNNLNSDSSDQYTNDNKLLFSGNQNADINKHKSNKVKDFAIEQQSFRKVYDSENRVVNQLSDPLLASQQVMRRKSSANGNTLYPSSQLDDRSSVPIASARQQHQQNINTNPNATLGDVYFVAIVACISAVAIFTVIASGYCFYKVQQNNKAAADVDYPAYGVVGPASKEVNTGGNTSPSGDRKLAQSAQMYHYHHQKQQMIASEKAVATRHTSASDVESEEENEEGEYTVYECPGLAPTGEMEVKNPLFHDDITPVSSPNVLSNSKEK